MLILRKPWDSQPQEVVELSAWAVENNFEFAFSPAGSAGLPLRITGSSGTPTTVAGSAGLARNYSSSADFLLDYGGLDPTSGYVWAWVGNWSAAGTWSGLIARTSDATTGASWSWQRNSSINTLTVFHGGTGANIGNINDLLSSDVAVWVGGWDAASGALSLYRNGELVRSGTLATVPTFTAGTGQIKLASSRDVALTTARCFLAAFATGRGPTEALAKAIAERPWRLFADQSIHIPVSAGGAPPTFIPSWAHRRARTIGAGVI